MLKLLGTSMIVFAVIGILTLAYMWDALAGFIGTAIVGVIIRTTAETGDSFQPPTKGE